MKNIQRQYLAHRYGTPEIRQRIQAEWARAHRAQVSLRDDEAAKGLGDVPLAQSDRNADRPKGSLAHYLAIAVLFQSGILVGGGFVLGSTIGILAGFASTIPAIRVLLGSSDSTEQL